jgi:hypothetical protein
VLIGNSITLATQRVVDPVQGMHRVISTRWFGAVGAAAVPAKRAHDAVSNVVYGSVRVGGAIAGQILGSQMPDTSAASESMQSVVNGLWGDALGPYGEQLEIPMAVRDRSGAPVVVPADLGEAFPDATGHLVVLVHGLVETERCWVGSEEEPGLVDALGAHPELTPVALRYNSGLRTSDNGIRLSDLLEEILAGWPVPVDSISLVGHSMGGLVIRSACEAAEASKQRWIQDAGDVVTLGTPHRGSPLEKAANVASWALAAAPDTRPLADFLNGRSAGIKDLRFGSVGEDDWSGTDPDALLRNTVGDHPLPSGIRHHFVAGVATPDAAHPLGIAVGDLVVRANSATGRRNLSPTSVAVLGGVRHLNLPRDPRVVERVVAWLTDADS